MEHQIPDQPLPMPEDRIRRRNTPGRSILNFFEFSSMALQITGYHLLLGLAIAAEPPVVAAEYVARRARRIARFFADDARESSDEVIGEDIPHMEKY